MAHLLLVERAGGEAQATHCVHMSAAAFKKLSLALHKLSVSEGRLASPRRLLTKVLADRKGGVFGLSAKDLARIWQGDHHAGTIRLNIRLDSPVNARLREFRDGAEQLLGRQVSVLEAIMACSQVMNGQFEPCQ